MYLKLVTVSSFYPFTLFSVLFGVDIPVGLQLLFGPVSDAAVEEDCTSGLIIEIFDDSVKVGTDVVLLRG